MRNHRRNWVQGNCVWKSIFYACLRVIQTQVIYLRNKCQKRRIRHTTTLKLKDEFLDSRLKLRVVLCLSEIDLKKTHCLGLKFRHQSFGPEKCRFKSWFKTWTIQEHGCRARTQWVFSFDINHHKKVEFAFFLVHLEKKTYLRVRRN